MLSTSTRMDTSFPSTFPWITTCFGTALVCRMEKKMERVEGYISGKEDSGGLCCICGWGDNPSVQSTLTSVIVEVLPDRSKLVHFNKILSLETARRYCPPPTVASLSHTSEETVVPIPRMKRRSGAFGGVETLSSTMSQALSASSWMGNFSYKPINRPPITNRINLPVRQDEGSCGHCRAPRA